MGGKQSKPSSKPKDKRGRQSVVTIGTVSTIVEPRHVGTSLDLIYSDFYNRKRKSKSSKGSSRAGSVASSSRRPGFKPKAFSDTDVARRGLKKGRVNRLPLPQRGRVLKRAPPTKGQAGPSPTVGREVSPAPQENKILPNSILNLFRPSPKKQSESPTPQGNKSTSKSTLSPSRAKKLKPSGSTPLLGNRNVSKPTVSPSGPTVKPSAPSPSTQSLQVPKRASAASSSSSLSKPSILKRPASPHEVGPQKSPGTSKPISPAASKPISPAAPKPISKGPKPISPAASKPISPAPKPISPASSGKEAPLLLRKARPSPSLEKRLIRTIDSRPDSALSLEPKRRPYAHSSTGSKSASIMSGRPPSSKIPLRTASEPIGKKQRRHTSDSCFGEDGRPSRGPCKVEHEQAASERSDSQTKKKLVIRGLRRFCDTHARTSSVSSYPSLWSREFPWKGKFHPDNYIYEWGEGPKAPVRPLTAMAKCKNHGGRCDNCGIFSRDLCQSCRKCELDCCCPPGAKRRGNGDGPSSSCPYPFPTNAYNEVFGDGWKKTCKVLCDLTNDERRNPVGGTSQKIGYNCNGDTCQPSNTCTPSPSSRKVRGRTPLNSKLYESQIDVLNPYNISMYEGEQNPGQYSSYMMLPPQYSMPMMPPMMPSMYPMTMPMMPVMAPPPMPYFSPPCSYDPFYGSSPYSPFPDNDAFMPMQNY